MAVIAELLNKRKDTAPTEDETLLNEIYRLRDALEMAYERFELQQDNDLVEATIFEIEALKARYRYMLGLAKTHNLKGKWVI